MPTKILREVEETFTAADIERSEQLATQLETLEAKTPEVLAERERLAQPVLETKRRLQDLKDARALPQQIIDAEKIYVRACREQDRPLHEHQLAIKAAQRELEKLTQPLLHNLHFRWSDEVAALSKVKKIETVSKRHDALHEIWTEDVLTNGPQIARATEMLLTAREQLQDLRYASITTIHEFVAAFEGNLKQIDLSKTVRWNDIPAWRSAELREKPPDEKSIQNAIILPGGETMIVGESQGDRLARRLVKLRKDLT